MLEVKNLVKIYQKKNKVLDNISFTIEQNDIVAFVGDNGAGKTTTIRAIFNELKIAQGEVLLDNENIFTSDNLKKVAYFSDIENNKTNIKVKEYLSYFGFLNKEPIKDIKKRITNNLKILNIEELENKKMNKISGGQKKKVLLVGVLMQSPLFIFFDEPTANLDVSSKIEFLEIIKHISKQNIGILITSHNIDELQRVANKLIIIQKGKIIFDQKLIAGTDDIHKIYAKFKAAALDLNAVEKLVGNNFSNKELK